MNFCPNCGSEVKVGVKFCPKCGYSLEKNEANQSAETMADRVKSQFNQLKQDEDMTLNLEKAEGLNITRSEIKKEAQRKLSGRYGEWMKSILWLIVGTAGAGAIFLLALFKMVNVIAASAFNNLMGNYGYGGGYYNYGNGIASSVSIFFWFIIMLAALIILLLIACMKNAVMQWCAIFTLKGKRADGMKIFNYFVKAQKNRIMKANILTTIYQFLWSLLFIIPGIVKVASYGMTNLILEKEPGLSATDAINKSRKIMHGYKLEFLILKYSFYFWQLVVGLTQLANFYVLPYQNVTEMQFLEMLYQNYLEKQSAA